MVSEFNKNVISYSFYQVLIIKDRICKKHKQKYMQDNINNIIRVVLSILV